MASIETLIDQIADASLRAKLAREVEELKKRRPWGLVFERHLPESTRMLVAPIKVGTAVWERQSSKPERFVVRAVDGDELEVAAEAPNSVTPDDAPTRRIARADVLVEHDLSQPIFPALTPIDSLRCGPVDRPSHGVIQGENHHALQALLVANERRFDVIYLDPPYNTGNKDWAYNNDYVDPKDTYRPSKWLAFMERRLRLARRLLQPDGVMVVTIDENEVHHIRFRCLPDDGTKRRRRLRRHPPRSWRHFAIRPLWSVTHVCRYSRSPCGRLSRRVTCSWSSSARRASTVAMSSSFCCQAPIRPRVRHSSSASSRWVERGSRSVTAA